MTHDELASDLVAHLRANSDVMTWENMQLGPSGSVRPDVFCISKSFAKFQPRIYEVKVSRSDFLADVTTGKWQSYIPFCSAVIFAAPLGLLRASEIPDGCGLICKGETWRMAKRPTPRVTETLPRDAWLKLLMSGIERQRESDKSFRKANEYVTAQKLREKHGERVAQAIRDSGKIDGLIELAEQQYEDALRRANEDAEYIKKRASNEYALLSNLRAELCVTLNLRAGANKYEMETAIHNLQTDKQAIVERFICSVKQAIQHAEDCCGLTDKPMPKSAFFFHAYEEAERALAESINRYGPLEPDEKDQTN